MGRVCQVIGWAIILLALVPVGFALSNWARERSGEGLYVAVVFSAPYLGGMVAGALIVTLGSILRELQAIRANGLRTAELLDRIADGG